MAKLAAGVRKRSEGTLEKRFTIDGKRYSIYGKNQKELNEKEIEIRARINSGLTDKKNITLDTYFNEYISHKAMTVKSTSIVQYKSYYKLHIGPILGRKKVQAIERRDIVKLQEKTAINNTIATANRTVKICNIVLSGALKDEIIDKNPAANITPLKDNKKAAAATTHRALTIDEQRAFIDEIRQEYYYEFIALMLCTGMRCGEVAALTWQDIDLKENVIHVNSTMTMSADNKPIKGNSPKTAAGKRDIPINDNILKIIKAQRAKRQIIPIENNYVFTAVYGGFIYNRMINLCIDQALKRLDDKGVHIDRFTSHALRDTFATRYIEQGGNMKTLQTLLGHSSLSMTMDLYAHVLPNTKAEEMSRIIIAI